MKRGQERREKRRDNGGGAEGKVMYARVVTSAT